MAESKSRPRGGFLDSPRNRRRLSYCSVAGLVLALGVLVSVVIFHGSANRFTDTFSNQAAQLAKPDPRTPLERQEITLARTFIKTAVERRDLAAAYSFVHPDLRGTLTKKQWMTGNIPVILYHAENVDTAQFLVDYSNQRSAMLEVDLVAKRGTETRPHLLFFLGLKRAGDTPHGRWLVSYWEPHWHDPILLAPD
jgi:hypothetical protein